MLSSFRLLLREMRTRMAAITAIMRIKPAIAIPMANVFGDKQNLSGSSSSSFSGSLIPMGPRVSGSGS